MHRFLGEGRQTPRDVRVSQKAAYRIPDRPDLRVDQTLRMAPDVRVGRVAGSPHNDVGDSLLGSAAFPVLQ